VLAVSRNKLSKYWINIYHYLAFVWHLQDLGVFWMNPKDEPLARMNVLLPPAVYLNSENQIDVAEITVNASILSASASSAL
jgi:hypothetical protein